MVLGVLLGIVGGVLVVRTAGANVIETFTTPVRSTPVDVTLDLDEGTYVVYEATSRGRGDGFDSTSSQDVTITPEDVLVVDAEGDPVVVEALSFDETSRPRQPVVHRGCALHRRPGGPHRSRSRALDSKSSWRQGSWVIRTGGRLVGTHRLRGTWSASSVSPAHRRHPSRLEVGPAQGGTADRSGRCADRPRAGAGAAARQPGWYDDPRGEARLRWWDGQQWTEHGSGRGQSPRWARPSRARRSPSAARGATSRGVVHAARPVHRSRTGSSISRTRRASRSTARPRTTPISFGGSGPESAKVKKTATMTAAAAKITRPECATEPTIASRGSPDFS